MRGTAGADPGIKGAALPAPRPGGRPDEGTTVTTAGQMVKRLSGATGLSGSLGPTRAALGRQLWLWPVLAALPLGALGWWVHRSVEQAMREEVAGQLTTVLNADVEALRTWTKD